MNELVTSELVLLTVPPPRSGHVVDLLKSIPAFAQAAAVYSGVDVVAIVNGTRTEIDLAIDHMMSQGAPIRGVDRFPVKLTLEGTSSGSRESLLRTSCTGFVRCEIRSDEGTSEYAGSVLAKVSGVKRVFLGAEEDELFLEIVAANKSAFDDAVMSKIQAEWSVVKNTRTLLVINEMQWTRPLTISGHADLFVSCSSHDIHFASSLVRRLESDLGLRCWTYLDIDVGSSWPIAADEAIRSAILHVFAISKDALASGECQREFGKVEAIAQAKDIALLILPDCEPRDLDLRYQQRQSIYVKDFLAYSRLLDWAESRLRQSYAG